MEMPVEKKERREIQKDGMREIADFVKSNLHYLSTEEQKLFHTLDRISRLNYIDKQRKPYYGYKQNGNYY